MNLKELLLSPFKKEIKKSEISAMLEKVNIDTFFDNLAHYYRPSELVRQLGGRRRFNHLLKDDDIYSCVDKRLAALQDTKLKFEGGDQFLVDFYSQQITPHEDQLKTDFWFTIYNGTGVEQIIYDPTGAKNIVGFEREQFWRFKVQPNLIEAKVEATSNSDLLGKILPWGKWVVTTYGATKENVFGEPLAEKLIQPWIFKCTGWDLWLDFAKRFSNGFLYAKVEDSDMIEEFREKLEIAGKSSILVTSKVDDVQMIQASRDSSIYSLIDDKTVAKIQRLILGETLSSSMLDRGSSGAAQVHNEVRLEKTRADIKFVEAAINQIVEQTAAVFGFSGELPKAKLIYDPGLNADLASRDATLNSIGVKFTKKYFETNYGLMDDDFTVDHSSGGGFPFSQKKRTFLSPEDVKGFLGPIDKTCSHGKLNLASDASVARKANRSYNEKEEIVQLLNRIDSPPLDMSELIAAINISKNSKELDENLSKLFDQKNNDFSEVLSMALYNAASRGAMLGNPKRLTKDEINEEE